mgnify:CR=1 FL=1
MEFIRVEDCCEILDSQRRPVTESERIPGIYPYYGANGIQGTINQYIFDEKLVLVAEDGGHFGSKTKPIAYLVNGKCWVNNHAHVLRAKKGFLAEYICYSLMFYKIEGYINGATRQKLTQAALRKLIIPKRSVEYQNAIVDRLDLVKCIIEKKQNIINELDLLIKSRFDEFNKTNKHVKKLKLEDVCSSIVRGPFGSALKVENFVKKSTSSVKVYEQVNAIQSSASIGSRYISKDHYELLKRFRCMPGDIIMSCSGTIGKLYILPSNAEKGIINQALCKFTLGKYLLPEVFLLYMNVLINNIETKGSGIKNISAVKFIKSLEIPVPSIELQKKLLIELNQINKLKSDVQKSIDETQLLMDSLMQEYFG